MMLLPCFVAVLVQLTVAAALQLPPWENRTTCEAIDDIRRLLKDDPLDRHLFTYLLIRNRDFDLRSELLKNNIIGKNWTETMCYLDIINVTRCATGTGASFGAWPADRVVTFNLVSQNAGVLGPNVVGDIEEAFGKWASAVPLRFERRPDGPVDVEIRFNQEVCLDSFMSMAKSTPLNQSGTVKIDLNSCGWLDRPDILVPVALHQIGHALGLKHSTEPSSIMYANHSGALELSPADVRAAQQLYGKP